MKSTIYLSKQEIFDIKRVLFEDHIDYTIVEWLQGTGCQNILERLYNNREEKPKPPILITSCEKNKVSLQCQICFKSYTLKPGEGIHCPSCKEKEHNTGKSTGEGK